MLVGQCSWPKKCRESTCPSCVHMYCMHVISCTWPCFYPSNLTTVANANNCNTPAGLFLSLIFEEPRSKATQNISSRCTPQIQTKRKISPPFKYTHGQQALFTHRKAPYMKVLSFSKTNPKKRNPPYIRLDIKREDLVKILFTHTDGWWVKSTYMWCLVENELIDGGVRTH